LVPFPDAIVAIRLPGKIFRQALENAFSKHPNLDGRWPALSGCKVTVDLKKEPGSRVVKLLTQDGSNI